MCQYHNILFYVINIHSSIKINIAFSNYLFLLFNGKTAIKKKYHDNFFQLKFY